MIPSCLRDCEKLLELIVIMMCIFATSSLKQCGPKTIVTFTNVGIKLCQLQCTEHGQCLSFEYDIETLTCHLSRDDSKKIMKKEGYTRLLKNYSDVSNGSCASMNCSIAQRCLKTRSGKSVCVQDGTHTERPPQQKVDQKEIFANSPLHDAFWKGDLGRVRHILSRGLVDINSRDDTKGRTPLMVAALKGHRKIVEFLLRKGANVSYVDNNGDNVLHWACRGGHVGLVKHLLSKYSIDVNCRGKSGIIPLMTTAYYGHRKVFDVLVGKGANVSLVDANGDCILHSACRGGHASLVKHLLSQYRFDINNRGKAGKTPLMTTVYCGHREVFDLLVGMGVNVSQVDDDGDCILHWACRGGHMGMVKHLLSQHSIDINSRQKTGRTPLMIAVYYGNIDLFKYLVGLGAHVSNVDDHGDNILHRASNGGHAKMIQHIISQDMVDINSRGRYGRTPLMRATYYGQREAFDVLVSSGCRTDLVDDQDHTILHLACLGGRMEMAEHILKQNMADINARDKAGKTAAIIAKRKGQLALYNVLVSSVCNEK